MKFWNLSERRRTVLKFEPKLDLKFMRVKQKQWKRVKAEGD